MTKRSELSPRGEVRGVHRSGTKPGSRRLRRGMTKRSELSPRGEVRGVHRSGTKPGSRRLRRGMTKRSELSPRGEVRGVHRSGTKPGSRGLRRGMTKGLRVSRDQCLPGVGQHDAEFLHFLEQRVEEFFAHGYKLGYFGGLSKGKNLHLETKIAHTNQTNPIDIMIEIAILKKQELKCLQQFLDFFDGRHQIESQGEIEADFFALHIVFDRHFRKLGVRDSDQCAIERANSR